MCAQGEKARRSHRAETQSPQLGRGQIYTTIRCCAFSGSERLARSPQPSIIDLRGLCSCPSTVCGQSIALSRVAHTHESQTRLVICGFSFSFPRLHSIRFFAAFYASARA